jgi:hypothetical protein
MNRTKAAHDAVRGAVPGEARLAAAQRTSIPLRTRSS